MHEWALAEAVIKTAMDKAKAEEMKKIDEIKLRIGEMQDIDMDIFKFALNEIMKDYDMLKGAKISITIQKTRFKCSVCGYEWGFEDMNFNEEEKEFIHFLPESIFSYSRCPKCGSQYFDIVEGRGVWIESIRGQK